MRIVFELTDVCNGGCKHCYQRAGKSVFLTRDIEQAKQDIKILLDYGHVITLGGAENLTEKRFLEIYQFVGQSYLLSNGIALANDSSLCNKMLFYGIRELYISWHIGFSDVINSILEQVVRRAISHALRAGLSVKVLCVISNLNFNRLDEITQTVTSVGAKSLRLFQLLPITEDLRRYQMTDEQRNETLVQIRALRRRYGKQILMIEVHGSFDATNLTDKRMISSNRGEFCPAGKSLIAIGTNNKIYPCPFLNSPEFCMGVFEDGKLIIDKQIFNTGKTCLAKRHFIG